MPGKAGMDGEGREVPDRPWFTVGWLEGRMLMEEDRELAEEGAGC